MSIDHPGNMMARFKFVRFALALPVAVCAAAFALPAGAEPSRDVTVAIAGDLLGPYHSVLQLRDPEFMRIVDLLRSADAGFANEEGSIFDLDDYHGYPAAENGGGLPLAHRDVAADFKAMGITLMSKANNHATDWSVDGLRLTELALDGAGIVHAGSGASERAARSPAYLDRPKGRFALVATASSYTTLSRAGDAGVYKGLPLRDRPGISVIANSNAVVVAPDEMAVLKAIGSRIGARDRPDAVTLGGQAFVSGAKSGLHYTANAADEDAVLASVKAASDTGATTIFSIHAHETASTDSEDPTPADFLPPLFHRAIDTGASIVVRHGPHALKGIEIYKGRPIFYGMASLFFDFGGKRGLTSADGKQFMAFPEAWYESALALVRFHGGALRDVRIYPITFEVGDGPTGGLPRLAHGADAVRILARLQRDSQPFGTVIDIHGDIGVITPGKPD